MKTIKIYGQSAAKLPIKTNKYNINFIKRRLWNHISDNYNIPEKEFRNSATKYEDSTIEKICYYLEKSYSGIEIAELLNIDISTEPKYKNWFNLLSRIKNRKVYTRISEKYYW